ncbi:proteasome regulatory particle base subunit rpn10 [Cryptotrichosporon argae]
MPLESCMLILDNSEYMRNGDYMPTRFGAQAQAVSSVFTAKTDSNPESAVGLMTMAGKTPSLLVTPTNDIGKLLSAASKANIGGTSNLLPAINVAQLALKHRENKNQRQRIVVFVGSPIDDAPDELVKLGKRLRKNNVYIDVVTFGEEGMANDNKLRALVDAAGDAESHLVSIPPGTGLLADAIQQSVVLYDPDRPGASGGGGDGMSGLDDLEASDPELAMALRMSLQEAQERERAAAPAAPVPAASTSVEQGVAPQAAPEPEVENATSLPSSVTAPLSNANDPSVPEAAGDAASGDIEDVDVGMDEDEGDDEDEEEMLRRAMALSRGENPDDDVLMDDGDDDDQDEDAAIARAIAMSLEDAKKDQDKPAQ